MHDKLTRGDIRKMEEEIQYRRLELRPKLLQSLKEARAHGDLSENFEYYAAKREKNRNESRIRYLENMVKTAIIIEDDTKKDQVGINNLVTVHFEEDNEDDTFKIVTTIRSDVTKNLISIDSPMGKALLRKKEGDRVEIKTETGYVYHVVIKKIEKIKDEDKDVINPY